MAPGNCLVVEDSVIGLQVDHISIVHVMIGHFCYTNFSFAGPNSLVTLKVLCCSCLCNLLDITAGTWFGNEPVITSSTITWRVY